MTTIRVAIVIDVFRAFTTACHVLASKPASYVLSTFSPVLTDMASNLEDTLLIGKPEIGADFIYNIPNSPTRVKEERILGRDILHRTEAGARGILNAKEADVILGAGFVNAKATTLYIQSLSSPEVQLFPMGHEGNTPSLEDELCAQYIECLLEGKDMDLSRYLPVLRNDSGRYFFSEDQWQYPREDFELCLEKDRFDFAVQAEVKGDYAILREVKIEPLEQRFQGAAAKAP
ncbi:MAG: putative 2-phosphosulfolactate phosphatase [Chlamydiae bacterium]|nr:putative 2-phosphosulfolactate phosphatase [Chlamydiota bacterium]